MAEPAYNSKVGGGTTATTTTTATLSTTAANDILLAVSTNGGANVALALSGTYAGGAWSAIGSGGWTSGWGGMWWSRCTGNHTTQTVISQTATDSIALHVVRITGCITTGTPYDTTFAEGTLAAGANGTLTPGFTTDSGDALVVCLVAVDDNAAVSAITMGGTTMGSLVTSVSSGGADAGTASAVLRVGTPAATGDFVLTVAAGTNQGKRVCALAMKPVPGVIPNLVMQPAIADGTFR